MAIDPKVTLTIKNYRCFVRPTEIALNKDFTAFVGVNNAGKSTLMRFLFEFRPLLQNCAFGQQSFLNSLGSDGWGINLHDVLDHEEVFSNLNQSGIEISLRFDYGPEVIDPILPREVRLAYSRRRIWTTTIVNGDGRALAGANCSFVESSKIFSNEPRVISDLRPFFAAARKLANTLYIGPFRNTINVGGNANYLDIAIGETFITKFRELKTGNIKRNNDAMLQLTEDVQRIFEFRSLNIEASHDNKSLQITVNGKSYKQHELGSGLLQFIVVLTNASIREPSYILIDEPEINLHPRLQLDFLTSLATHASEGVWFSTHSLGLARSTTELIYSVNRKGDGDSVVSLLDANPRLAEFLGEMSFSSYKELGFKKILLVEGPTDVKTLQQLLRKMASDHKFVLLPLGGGGRINGDMRVELEEIMRITTDVAALIDSEKSSPDEPLSRQRKEFVELCGTMNIDCHVLERRATENYFPEEVVKSVFGPQYRALGEYEHFKRADPHWSKNENWRLAHAMPIAEIERTDLGIFLKDLCA